MSTLKTSRCHFGTSRRYINRTRQRDLPSSYSDLRHESTTTVSWVAATPHDYSYLGNLEAFLISEEAPRAANSRCGLTMTT